MIGEACAFDHRVSAVRSSVAQGLVTMSYAEVHRIRATAAPREAYLA